MTGKLRIKNERVDVSLSGVLMLAASMVVKPASGGSGHVGILDFDGMLISAQEFRVTRGADPASWSSRVCRSYREEEQ